jgi:hypothetical protein
MFVKENQKPGALVSNGTTLWKRFCKYLRYSSKYKWSREASHISKLHRQCIGPNALSQICKVFAEEYEHRTGGMPDLW